MSAWLQKLRNAELHRLAVLLGAPCSGTKASRIEAIQAVTSPWRKDDDNIRSTFNSNGGSVLNCTPPAAMNDDGIRVLSIDMGIRNLAYALLIASPTKSITNDPMASSGHQSAPDRTTLHLQNKSSITLELWNRVDVTSSQDFLHGRQGLDPSISKVGANNAQLLSDLKVSTASSTDDQISGVNAYHPLSYATRTYSIAKSILDLRPTHVIIERQRFRSGGGAAVQEWSLRVGMFEAMLWATLQTLVNERTSALDKQPPILGMESILPVRVNRYWLEEQGGIQNLLADAQLPTTKKTSGKETKKAKIVIASNLLGRIGTKQTKSEIGQDQIYLGAEKGVQDLAKSFQYEVNKRTGKKRSKMSDQSEDIANMTDTKISKLDDLADCLLQGLAWLGWRKNRLKMIEHGEKAFDLGSSSSSSSSSNSAI